MIKFLLIAIILLVMLFLVLSKQNSKIRAWKKITLFAFILLAVITILFPDTVSYLATLVGVGRGTDLLLYLFILAFFVYVINNYIARQNDKDKLYRLARKIALLEARLDEKDK